MRLTDFCNRLTTRAPLRRDRFSSAPPSSLTALRSEHTRRRPEPPAVSRVELRLTANLQLRRSPDLPCCPTTAEARGHAGEGASLVPGGCRDRRPLERCLPAAVFSTACRARDVASDTLCRAPPRRDRSLAAPESQVRFRRHLVKGSDVHTPGRLPSTSAPYTPLARGITRSPPPFSRLRRRDPASGARSPRTRTSMNSSADEARPTPLGAGQTPLVDFCNQTIREHDRWVVRTPISAIESCLPVGREPVEPKPTDAVDQVTSPFGVQQSLSTLPDKVGDASRGFTGQGPWAFARRRPSSRLLAARALPQPDRLGHLLS
jgi:hypothetical protein